MNSKLITGAVILGFCAVLATPLRAAEATAESVGILEEKIGRLTAQVEDLQFRQKKLEDDLTKIKDDLHELRSSGGTGSATDLKALQDRIQAVDTARQKDKQAIIDQLAKELAGIGGTKPGKTTVPPPSDGKEHVVQKGEYLAAIARKYGVSITDLKKANNLTSSEIKVGQKLVIPQK